MRLGGTRAGQSFSIALKFNEDARFETSDGVLVSAQAASLAVRLDVRDWLNGVALGDCDDDEEGDECGPLENQLKRNIKESGQVGR